VPGAELDVGVVRDDVVKALEVVRLDAGVTKAVAEELAGKLAEVGYDPVAGGI